MSENTSEPVRDVNVYDHLQDENRRLKRAIAILQRQLQAILSDFEGGTGKVIARSGEEPLEDIPVLVSQAMTRVWSRLPEEFSIEDFIITCEETDVSVFRAYSDLQVLIGRNVVVQHEDLFRKVRSSVRFTDI